MNKLKKFIARVFGIKTEIKNVVVQKVIQTIRDREFTEEEFKYISDFLNTKAGEQLCQYLLAQKLIIAAKSASFCSRGDFWQGYANGFSAAIDNFLTFRQPDANGEISSDSSEVGLDELATKLDQ